jgi:site-specific DNA-methyltransferase (adenine-specific)
MENLRTETVKISALIPDPDNARTHDSNNIRAISGSLQRFGQRKPIVVSSQNVIVAGNGTVDAAKQLGWDEIVIVRTPKDWTHDQAKAYALADNRTAELAEWDTKVLADQLIELDAVGWDVSEFGFEVLQPPTEPEDTEPLNFDEIEPKVKLGELWQLGEHRLLCGDSTDEKSVAYLMGNTKADMAFTDPPYGVEYTGGIQFKNGSVEKNNREMIKNDDADIYKEVFSILSKFVSGACYIWFAGTKASSLYSAAEQYGTIHALIIWVKNGGYGALNANYKQKHEPCLYWKPKNANLNFIGATTETTIWDISKDGRNEYHPTQKPVDLALKAIKNHQGKTVLDLFGGSGSTLIACEYLKKQAFVLELDPKYCDVIIDRWQKLTGETPKRLEF